jgi:hypothetical protein
VTGQHVCITNDVADLRSCTLRGMHQGNCDGVARRYDVGTGQTILLTRPVFEEGHVVREYVDCTGCLPRFAEVGYLCDSHLAKMRQLFARDADEAAGLTMVDLVTHLWSIESNGTAADGGRSSGKPGSRWTLSESHILANAIYTDAAATAVAFANDLRIDEPRFSPAASILDGFALDLDVDIVGVLVDDLFAWLHENADAAIRRRNSAERVVRLTNVVQAAMSAFPLVDTQHHVPFVRCPECAQMRMEWKPPLMFLDEVEVVCSNCGHKADQDWLEAYIHAVRTDPRRRA